MKKVLQIVSSEEERRQEQRKLRNAFIFSWIVPFGIIIILQIFLKGIFASWPAETEFVVMISYMLFSCAFIFLWLSIMKTRCLTWWKTIIVVDNEGFNWNGLVAVRNMAESINR